MSAARMVTHPSKFGPFPTPFGRALRKFGTEVEADRPRAEAEFRRQLYGA